MQNVNSNHHLENFDVSAWILSSYPDSVCSICFALTLDSQHRWFKLLQDNMSPVQLCDLSYMTKHELPIQRPPDGFTTPVLSLVGDQDFVVDVEAADETAQHFGEAKAVALKDAAHDLMLVRASTTSSKLTQHCYSFACLDRGLRVHCSLRY